MHRGRQGRVAAHGRRAAVLTPILALGAAALAACSSAGPSAQGSQDGTAHTQITILTMASLTSPLYSNPQVATAAEAFVKQVNDHGGINGHSIALKVCDTDFNPNTTLACFEEAVTDKVQAVVGSFFDAPAGLALLQKAGIPNIGSQGILTQEFTSPISFPSSGGVISWFYGVDALLKQAGVSKPAVMISPPPDGTLAQSIITQGWDRSGSANKVKFIYTEVDQPTYTTQAAQVENYHPNGVVVATATNDVPKQVTALRQAGYTGPIFSIDPYFNAPTIAALGSQANGIRIASNFIPLDSRNSELLKMKSAMNAVDRSAAQDGNAENAWNAFDLFDAIASSISGNITSASLLRALKSHPPIELPLSGKWVSPGTVKPPISEFPQIGALNFIPTQIENGKSAATAPATDPLAVLAGSGS
jgi:branched-chain amino acid transport system substrate-binding protein